MIIQSNARRHKKHSRMQNLNINLNENIRCLRFRHRKMTNKNEFNSKNFLFIKRKS